MHIPSTNLRLLEAPARCLSGQRIPPGLNAFLHETPISLGLLDQHDPHLAVMLGFDLALHHVARDVDATLGLCAGYMAHTLSLGLAEGELPERPSAWPAAAYWPERHQAR